MSPSFTVTVVDMHVQKLVCVGGVAGVVSVGGNVSVTAKFIRDHHKKEQFQVEA